MMNRSLMVGLLLISLVVFAAVGEVSKEGNPATPTPDSSNTTTASDATNTSATTTTPPPGNPAPHVTTTVRQTRPVTQTAHPVAATETTPTTTAAAAPVITTTTAAPPAAPVPAKPVVHPIPPTRPQSLPWWLLTLLILNTLLALTAVALLALPLFKPKPQPNFDDTELGRRLARLTERIGDVQAFLSDKIQKRGDELHETIAKHVTREQLDAELQPVLAHVASLDHTIEEIATAPPTTSSSPVDPTAIEHQVLGECWKQFRDHKELSAAFDAALHDSSWDGLLTDLGKLVPDDLRPSFDNVVAPCREYRTLVRKVSLIPQIVSGELKRLGSDAEEVRRTREYASLLASMQSGDNGNRLNFRFKSWITDSFLPFADLYLQRYQQAQLESRHREMQRGVQLVRQLLHFAAVEPIEVTLGETAFDSALHIGRSTTNDPRFSDGVITGVVRNGFVEGGQQVIRHPEVIVNRMR